MPLIVICGVCTNISAFCVLHGKHIQKTSFVEYLKARSLTDNGFLLAMFIAWLDAVDVRWFHTQGICQITVFFAYICSFLSVWFVTYAAMENYIRMRHPDKVNIYCTTRNARCIILVSVGISLAIYNFPLWTATVYGINGKQYCQPRPRFDHVLLVALYFDSICTFLIPLSIIFVSMCAVVFDTYRASKRRLRMGHRTRVPGAHKVIPHVKATLFLLGISLSFLILHTPSHIFRIKIIILSYLRGSMESDKFQQTDRDLKKYFELLYYLNFAINFFIYFLCGKKFRVALYSQLHDVCARDTRMVPEVRFDRELSNILIIPSRNHNTHEHILPCDI